MLRKREVIVEGITAAVCTRNRGALVCRAVQSILANDQPASRVIVVDQSTNAESEAALSQLTKDSRVQYIRSNEVGVSRARNMCLRSAQTDVVAFTDDDCEVPADWLGTFQAIMAEFPRVTLAFCTVRAGPHNPAMGFVPAYQCRGTRIARGLTDKCTARGMGAGLAVRRRPLLGLGGFDEELGPGGRFPSCEEGDLAVRALLARFEVCETDRTYVIHHGFRSWSEGRELARRDWLGIGAAYAKPFRGGRWDFAPVPLYELLAKALWPPLNDLIHLRRPRGAARALHFVRGFSLGLRAPFDRESLLFKSATGDGQRRSTEV
jgi:glycosyltransferase involved in cell wall biosynthesis